MAESKKTALVTGCSDGSLGSALALALHDLGWRVFASARNPSKMTVVKAAGMECVQMDVGSNESISAAVKYIQELTGGSLDSLINNAGGGYSMPVINLDIEKTRELFELNFISIIRVTQAFLPLLLRSDRDPTIANNTSGVGLLGCSVPFQGGYAASKAAAASLTDSMRLELAPFGIRVINLVTGGVQSTFFQNSNDAQLPADSIYNIAKEAITGPMNGDQPGMNKIDAKTWANQVARDLSQRTPPYMIYRGSMAGVSRLASLLPTWITEGIRKRMSGIDVLEQKLKEQRARDKAVKS